MNSKGVKEKAGVTYKNYALLVQAVFLNFVLLIEKPTKAGQLKLRKDPVVRQKQLKRWYTKALKWCDSDNWLFDGYESYFAYSGERIRGILKKRIQKKLEQL